jgi:hypothetical protein
MPDLYFRGRWQDYYGYLEADHSPGKVKLVAT